jgi:predicted ATPase
MLGRISSAAFVGRHGELRRLNALLAGVTSQSFATVLIGGEAGVGKTRLLSEFRASAEARGTRYLAGACMDVGEGARPYDPLVAAFRPFLRSLDEDEFKRRTCSVPGLSHRRRQRSHSCSSICWE